MDISVVREFLVLSQTLNYSAASRQLYISQPVLSRHIMALEEELGAKLFTRNRRSVRLTEAGNIFLKSAQEMLTSYETARTGIRNLESGYESTMRVGYVHPTTVDYLPAACAKFHEQNPDTHITLLSRNVEDIIADVRDGIIDLGYVVAADGLIGGLETSTIFRDRYGILCLKGSALAKRDSIRLKDLAGVDLLMPDPLAMPSLSMVSIRAFDKCETKPRFVEEMHDPGTIAPFLMTGGEAAFTLGHVHDYLHNKEQFVFVPIEDVDVRPHMTVCWKESHESEKLLEFVEALRNAYEERR